MASKITGIESDSSYTDEDSSLDEPEDDEHDDDEDDLPSGLLLQASKLSLREDVYCDIPILKCPETIKFISRSKILILMKGLPGSGKSTLVKALSKTYPDSAVCSADFYFEGNKKYKFEKEHLVKAHLSCKRAAVSAAEQSTRVIIIDNTNVQNWEMRFYLKVARTFNYLVMVVEPQTPWCKNPLELANRNSHGVEAKVLAKKVKFLEDVRPNYVGWFLNEPDSTAVLHRTTDWLRKAFEGSDQFRADLRTRVGVRSFEDLVRHFSGGKYALDETRLLHCTAKYTAKDEGASLAAYMARVGPFVGSVAPLHLGALLLTPKTLGARVALTEAQRGCWGARGRGGRRRGGSTGRRRSPARGSPFRPTPPGASRSY